MLRRIPVTRKCALAQVWLSARFTSTRGGKTAFDEAVAAPTQPKSSTNAQHGHGGGSAEAPPPEDKKPPETRFTRMLRGRGVAFTLYFYFVAEVLALFFTYLLHMDILGAGDVVAWLDWIGISKWFDIDRYAGKHVTIFGYTLSARLLLNYGIASTMLVPATPLELAFCAYTLPWVLRVTAPLKFWKKTSSLPKAPPAAPAAGVPHLPK